MLVELVRDKMKVPRKIVRVVLKEGRYEKERQRERNLIGRGGNSDKSREREGRYRV